MPSQARQASADSSGGGQVAVHSPTKYQRAVALVSRFPELEARLPRQRKPWMTEDSRINIFDALGFAVVCFPVNTKEVDDTNTAA